MKAETYIGGTSGKMHLEVNGITLATEGDLCRDTQFRHLPLGGGVWARDMLILACKRIQEFYDKGNK